MTNNLKKVSEEPTKYLQGECASSSPTAVAILGNAVIATHEKRTKAFVHTAPVSTEPGAQMSATASETDSIFSQHGNVGAELKMIDTVTLRSARDSLPYKMNKRAFIQLGKQNPVLSLALPIPFPSETCKLAGRSNIKGLYLENFVFHVIVSRKLHWDLGFTEQLLEGKTSMQQMSECKKLF